jgi:hypothetical protein
MIRITALILATIASAAMPVGNAAQAMKIRQFDKMNTDEERSARRGMRF